MSDQQIAIGVDLGGTAIKSGLVRRDGSVLAMRTDDTEAEKGPSHVLDRIARIVKELLRDASLELPGVAAMGLGLPGPIDRARGTSVAMPNLRGWKNVAVVDELAKRTHLRVVIENDANNAALGELVAGAGRGLSHMVLLTLGTGIGGGIILNGRLWRGATGSAAEIGHTLVERDGRRCGCGQRGCLEAYASAAATAARVKELLAAGRTSILANEPSATEAITSRHIVDAVKEGDALAREVWAETCYYLAVACINIQHVLEPQRIVFSGGMSAAGQWLLDGVNEAVARLRSGMIGPPPQIALATLGNDAGFIGSALNAFDGP